MVRSILKPRSRSPPPSTSSSSSSPIPSSFAQARHIRHPSFTFDQSLLPFISSLPTPHVHFPPTPTLVSSTYTAYPSTIYDRAPIEVSPNSCAMPERGDRIVHAGSPPIRMITRNGNDCRSPLSGNVDEEDGYFHSSFMFNLSEPPTDVPELVRDVSSSSEESEDGCSDHPGYSSPHFSPIPTFQPVPPTAVSFLPHPHPHSHLKKEAVCRPRLKRRKTPGSLLCPTRKSSVEEPPSLDGCLGGF